MSEKVLCEKEDLTAIADAVRTNANVSTTFTVPQLRTASVQAMAQANGEVVLIDNTLTQEGWAADAKATGDAIAASGYDVYEYNYTLTEEDAANSKFTVSFEGIGERRVNRLSFTLMHESVGGTAITEINFNVPISFSENVNSKNYRHLTLHRYTTLTLSAWGAFVQDINMIRQSYDGFMTTGIQRYNSTNSAIAPSSVYWLDPNTCPMGDAQLIIDGTFVAGLKVYVRMEVAK